MNTKPTRFSIIHHVPQYTKLLAKAVVSPLPLYIALVGNSVMLISAYLFYHFESSNNPQVTSYFDAIWWAMSTVSTIGFGDVVPHTFEGRLVAMGLIVVGVFMFVSFTASIMAIISDLSSREMEQELENLRRHEFQEVMKRLEKIEALLHSKHQSS